MQSDSGAQVDNTIVMWITDFLAPPYCVFCAAPLPVHAGSICRGCYTDLPWATAPRLSNPDVLHSSISMLDYEFPIDAAIKAMKFKRKMFYVPALAEVLATALPLLPVDIDAVVPVPLHWRRKALRGFNQATEIAVPFANRLDVPVLQDVRRQKATPFQSGLGADERAKNLRDAFVVSAGLSIRHALIIDDVLTTGATITQLAKVLTNAGAAKVSALTVARVT